MMFPYFLFLPIVLSSIPVDKTTIADIYYLHKNFQYTILVERFETAKAQQEEVQATITEKQAQRKMMENFMEELRGLPEQVDYFDEGAWCTMVNFVTVYGKDDVRFTFKNGMEIKV